MIAGIPTRDDPICQITDIVDGDTVKMVCDNGRGGSVRLVGYDTPETYRPGCAAELRLGQAATQRLEHHLRAARRITVKYEGKDRYDRVLVRMNIDGTDLAGTMIAEGVAVAYDGGTRIDWCDRLRTA